MIEVTTMYLPNQKFLRKTGDVDYYHWNYLFPIKYIQRFRFQAILRLLGNTIYDRLLEVGTGSGIFLPELSKHCRDLYAIDIHDKMKAVEELCKLTDIKANLMSGSIENTNYPNDFFNAIVAVSVLEFVDDLNSSIQELKRILKPRGFFVTICPQQSRLLDFFLGLYSRKNPSEEFRESRTRVVPKLEADFNVIKKRVFPPLLGRIIPVYYYYKLEA